MSQKNDTLLRTCEHCKTQIATTAKGIREHAAECSRKRMTIIERMKDRAFVHGQVGE